ncbi:unnamed protein product [Durusdinium trenchii]|uniref:HNH nuclease domain-containing protein n=1 Tax=Durusdinium trenchii TaxID=1381693 RepID=A0ABP0IN30_9DINO
MQGTRRAWCVRCCWPRALQHFASESFHHPKQGWQVSSLGRLCNTRGVISNGSLQADGYKAVQICGRKWPVHRVVKITFDGLPISEEAWQVHHVDGSRANNRLDNLRYVTPSENVRHSYSSHSRCTCGPAQSKTVLWRPVGSANWIRNPSVTAAAQQLGMSRETVSRCCHKNTAARGYEFSFRDQCDFALPGEEWRPMVNPVSGALVPGRKVSSLGRVTSRTGLIGRGHLIRKGYYTTQVQSQNSFVHRLVAIAFLGPPPSAHQTCVNHKDLDKGNNAVDNLEWVSPAENLFHFYATSIREGREGRTTAKPVWSRPHGTDAEWRWHRSRTSAASELGLCRRSISRCTHGLQWQTGGFEFRDAHQADALLPGEEWREIHLPLLERDREARRRWS